MVLKYYRTCQSLQYFKDKDVQTTFLGQRSGQKKNKQKTMEFAENSRNKEVALSNGN